MKPAVNMRGLIALVVALSFLALACSGIVLYLIPHGRAAAGLDWLLLGLSKTAWEDLHVVFAAVFLIAAVVHLFPYNWTVLKRHVVRRRTGACGLHCRWEALAAVVLVAFVAGATLGHLPPADSLLNLRGALTAETWSGRGAAGGPAEDGQGAGRGGGGSGFGRMSVSDVAMRLGVDYQVFEARLAGAGIIVQRTDSLRDIAARHGLSPGELTHLAAGER